MAKVCVECKQGPEHGAFCSKRPLPVAKKPAMQRSVMQVAVPMAVRLGNVMLAAEYEDPTPVRPGMVIEVLCAVEHIPEFVTQLRMWADAVEEVNKRSSAL